MIRTILTELHTIGAIVEPSKRISAIQEDPDDNRILECAVEASAKYAGNIEDATAYSRASTESFDSENSDVVLTYVEV